MNRADAAKTLLTTYGYSPELARVIIDAAEADEDGYCDSKTHVDADLLNGNLRNPRFSYRVGRCNCNEYEPRIPDWDVSGVLSADGQVYSDADPGL